ncbi:MAG: sigma-70 family RNA polymerase sigma factor [Planctomycetes bacterium]|nr:sigma-70 family RNA polymerase sigma factor [Planctomycetota bacterium]
MSDSDLALLDRWRRMGDAHSFAEIVARHSGMVYNTCRRILNDFTEAEDVAQECFLRLAKGDGAIDRSLGSWLHAVATRLSLNQLRSEGRRRRRERLSAERSRRRDDPAWGEIRHAVDEAIAELPEGLRLPVIARFLEGRTFESIAGSLGIPCSTVRGRVDRGIEAIRAGLRRRGIHVAAVALTALLARESATAVPGSLVAGLGKLALAGTAGTARTSVAIGRTVLMAATKKSLSIAGLSALVLLVLPTYVLHQKSRRPADDRDAGRAPAAENRMVTRPDPAGSQGASESAARASIPGDSAQDPAEETAGEEAADVVRPASVSGRVMDEGGSAIAFSRVYVEISGDKAGTDVLKRYEGVTDVDGEYRVSGIETFGRATAFAVADGYAMGFSGGKYLEEGLDLTGLDVRLHEASRRIEGMVVSEVMEPIPGACVQIRYYAYDEKGLEITAKTGGTTGNITGGKFMFAITDGDGRFAIAVDEEGLCDFTVLKEGYAAGFFPKVPAGKDDALFVMRSHGAIEGRVLRDDGGALADARVEVKGYALPGGLEPSDVSIQSFRLKPMVVHADARGAYRASGLSEDYIYDFSAKETDEDGAETLARRRGVRVRAGQTIGGVDLVLDARSRKAIVHGTVKNALTGLPVHPLVIFAAPPGATDREARILGGFENVSKTRPDGSYELKLDVAGRTDIRVFWRFSHSGGWGPLKDGVEYPALTIEPGRSYPLDIAVDDEPYSISFRFVGKDGEPLGGIKAGIHLRDRGWGMQITHIISAADGRATWHGLSPGETYQALGFKREGPILGRSARFSVPSGETAPEIEVVCISRRGGVEGTLVDPEGQPIADAEIWCAVLPPVVGNLEPIDVRVSGSTDRSGAFRIPSGLPEGRNREVFLLHEDPEKRLRIGSIENMELEADEVLNLGALVLAPVSGEEADRMLRGR